MSATEGVRDHAIDRQRTRAARIEERIGRGDVQRDGIRERSNGTGVAQCASRGRRIAEEKAAGRDREHIWDRECALADLSVTRAGRSDALDGKHTWARLGQGVRTCARGLEIVASENRFTRGRDGQRAPVGAVVRLGDISTDGQDTVTRVGEGVVAASHPSEVACGTTDRGAVAIASLNLERAVRRAIIQSTEDKALIQPRAADRTIQEHCASVAAGVDIAGAEIRRVGADFERSTVEVHCLRADILAEDGIGCDANRAGIKTDGIGEVVGRILQPQGRGEQGLQLHEAVVRIFTAGHLPADDPVAVAREDRRVAGAKGKAAADRGAAEGGGRATFTDASAHREAAGDGILTDANQTACAVRGTRATTGDGNFAGEIESAGPRGAGEHESAARVARVAGVRNARDRDGRGAGAEIGGVTDDHRAILDHDVAVDGVRDACEIQAAGTNLGEAGGACENRADLAARAETGDGDERGIDARGRRERERAAGDDVARRGECESARGDRCAERDRAGGAAENGDVEIGVVPRDNRCAIPPVAGDQIIPRASAATSRAAREERVPETVARLCLGGRAEHERGRGEHRDGAREREGLARLCSIGGCDFLFPLGGEFEEEAVGFHILR